MTNAISTDHLSKQFGRNSALEDVSFSVAEGTIYALVGANGAGKTTLIKLLVNILAPTAGRATVLGMDVAELQGEKFNRIGYVSENQEMAEWATVGGMLDYFRPFYPQWDRELEARLVRQFDLPLKRRLKQLSRGMRMKAALVSSLAYRPALLVLDEPLSGLDPFVRDELIEGLREQARETTIVLSSHDLAEIESFATHVGFIEQGRMLFSEEMAGLMGRFRAVTVSGIAAGVHVSEGYPSAWLNAELVDGMLRFAHSDYQGLASEAELRAILPQASEVQFEEMPLRAIFLAIAKASRLRKIAIRDGVAA